MDIKKLKTTFDIAKNKLNKEKDKLHVIVKDCVEIIKHKKEEKQPQIDQLKKKATEKTKHIVEKIEKFKENHKID